MCAHLQGPANIEAIALLVELGADVDATLAQRSLETPLHIAARSGRLDIVERLLKCPQARGRGTGPASLGLRHGCLPECLTPRCFVGCMRCSFSLPARAWPVRQSCLPRSLRLPALHGGRPKTSWQPNFSCVPGHALPCCADQRDVPNKGRLHRPPLRRRLWADTRPGRSCGGGLPG